MPVLAGLLEILGNDDAVRESGNAVVSAEEKGAGTCVASVGASPATCHCVLAAASAMTTLLVSEEDDLGDAVPMAKAGAAPARIVA